MLDKQETCKEGNVHIHSSFTYMESLIDALLPDHKDKSSSMRH